MDPNTRVTAFVSLYSYFQHAETLRYEFHRYSAMPEVEPQASEQWFPEVVDPKQHGAAVFAIQWFAALYVVVEGWMELGLHDQEMDRLLISNNVDHLRQFRNLVYHYQIDSMNDPRRLAFTSDPGLVEWAMDLSQAFRRFFAHQNEKEEVFGQVGAGMRHRGEPLRSLQEPEALKLWRDAAVPSRT